MRKHETAVCGTARTVVWEVGKCENRRQMPFMTSIYLLPDFYAWGLTELTVNSCFFDTPPRVYLNYNIYILIFICVWGEPCIFGVLTVNLLTPRSFFPVSVLCGA